MNDIITRKYSRVRYDLTSAADHAHLAYWREDRTAYHHEEILKYLKSACEALGFAVTLTPKAPVADEVAPITEAPGFDGRDDHLSILGDPS